MMQATDAMKTIWLVLILKGTSHVFCRSGKPINHFQKQRNIHILQNNNKIPVNLLKLRRKTRFLASFILEGTLTVFLISYIVSFIICVAFERKDMLFLRIE